MNTEQMWRYWLTGSAGSCRPGWLPADQAWQEQLAALTEADVAWCSAQWELASGGAPARQTLTTAYFDPGAED